MRAVLERDFLSTASRGRAFLLRALVAAVVTTVIWLVFLENRLEFIERPDTAARYVFAGGSIALLSLLFLVTPPSVIGSILEERQRDTLPLVLASPVGPRALAAAKLLARSMAVLQWALAALVPIFAVTLLGGVATSQVADLAMLTVAIVLELAAWSLCVSSFTARLATGAILAYILPTVRWALTLGALALFATHESPREFRVESTDARRVFWSLGATTPVPGIGRMAEPAAHDALLADSFRGVWYQGEQLYLSEADARSWISWGVTPGQISAPPRFLYHPAALYLLSSIAFAGFAVLLAGRRLAREAEPRTGPFARFLDRKRERRRPPEGGNPVAWKEQRLLNTAASRPLYYTVIALMAGGEVFFLVSCGTWLRHEREFMEFGLAFATIHVSLIGLVAVVAGSAAMAHERTTGSLDLLRASPLSPVDIVRGKLLGLLRGLGLLALFPVAHLLLCMAVGYMDPFTAAAGILLEGTFMLFFAMAGMVAGLSSPSMGAAVMRGAMAYGIFLLGIPLAAILLALAFGEKGAAETLILGCPAVTNYVVLEGSIRALHGPFLAAQWYADDPPLRPEHMTAMKWAAAYGIASLLGWWWSPRLLARRFEREREEG